MEFTCITPAQFWPFVSSWHTALLTTWGLGFGGVWMLASAHALHLPTIKVQVFHAGLRVEVQGPVISVVQWCSVFRIKSKFFFVFFCFLSEFVSVGVTPCQTLHTVD